MTTRVRDDVLLITTIGAADSQFSTRIYLLSDLLDADKDVAAHELKKFVKVLQMTTGNPRVSWAELGGTGVVDPIEGLNALAVTTTRDAHDQIEKLFNDIRRSRKAADGRPKADGQALGNGQRTFVQVWMIDSTVSQGESPGLTSEKLKDTILALIASPTAPSPDEAPSITALPDRLIVRAKPAILNRIERMATKELAGLIHSQDDPAAFQGESNLNAIVTAPPTGLTTPAVAVPPTLPPATNE